MCRPVDVLGDEAGVGGHGRPVVARRVRDVHAGQLADHRLVFEDRLEDALAHLRLIRRVRGQELAAREDRVDDGRHVVVVDAGAEERQLLPGVRVALGQLRQVGHDLRLGERRLEGERSRSKRTPSGMSRKSSSIDDDTDCGEHRVAVRLGEREVAHWLGRGARDRPRRREARPPREASERRMRTSQPSPCGSSLIVSGSATTLPLTSRTSPESGAITSLTALTDSTSP